MEKYMTSGNALATKISQMIPIEKGGYERVVRGRKAVLTKRQFKGYTVTVRYLQLSDGEIANKKAVISRILNDNGKQ